MAYFLILWEQSKLSAIFCDLMVIADTFTMCLMHILSPSRIFKPHSFFMGHILLRCPFFLPLEMWSIFKIIQISFLSIPAPSKTNKIEYISYNWVQRTKRLEEQPKMFFVTLKVCLIRSTLSWDPSSGLRTPPGVVCFWAALHCLFPVPGACSLSCSSLYKWLTMKPFLSHSLPPVISGKAALVLSLNLVWRHSLYSPSSYFTNKREEASIVPCGWTVMRRCPFDKRQLPHEFWPKAAFSRYV